MRLNVARNRSNTRFYGYCCCFKNVGETKQHKKEFVPYLSFNENILFVGTIFVVFIFVQTSTYVLEEVKG